MVEKIAATDNYDRLLRYAFLREENPETDSVFVNERLARQGLAEAEYVRPNRRYLQQLQAAEREAEAGKAGLWAKCDPRKSEAWRVVALEFVTIS